MSKRIKYMIFYGLIGAIMSWILFGLVIMFVGFIFALILVIGFWLFTIYLGYRQGVDAENNINNVPSVSIKETTWSAFKIIAIIMILGVAFLLFIFLAGTFRKKNTMSVLTTPATSTHANYDIMNFMEEARIYATFCNDKKVEIVSANGGDKFCNEGASYNSINKLRQMNFCGDKPEDTRWIVANGKGSDWTIELNCKNFTICNGKNNAYCNTNGCTFGKGCDPRKK